MVIGIHSDSPLGCICANWPGTSTPGAWTPQGLDKNPRFGPGNGTRPDAQDDLKHPSLLLSTDLEPQPGLLHKHSCVLIPRRSSPSTSHAATHRAYSLPQAFLFLTAWTTDPWRTSFLPPSCTGAPLRPHGWGLSRRKRGSSGPRKPFFTRAHFKQVLQRGNCGGMKVHEKKE